ncbi:MAG: alpha/beta fold hydrolase [Dehalococcoidia bacterium]
MGTTASGHSGVLAHDRAGSGPPVVLLHGWPGDRTDFAEVARLLQEGGTAETVVPDLLGFGQSRGPEGAVTGVDEQVRAVVGLMDDVGLASAVLAGYDVGSRVAQTLAATHPGRVEALVVAPPLPGAGRRVLDAEAQPEFWYQSFHRLPLASELIDGRADAVRAYLTHFWSRWSGPSFTPEPQRLDHLTERYAAPGAFTASIAWYRSGSAMIARSLAEHPPTRRITTPTTVLWPEHDPLFPPGWSDRLDEWFTDVRLRMIDGVGHFVPVEAPGVFVEAITAAVRGTATPAGPR